MSIKATVFIVQCYRFVSYLNLLIMFQMSLYHHYFRNPPNPNNYWYSNFLNHLECIFVFELTICDIILSSIILRCTTIPKLLRCFHLHKILIKVHCSSSVRIFGKETRSVKRNVWKKNPWVKRLKLLRPCVRRYIYDRTTTLGASDISKLDIAAVSIVDALPFLLAIIGSLCTLLIHPQWAQSLGFDDTISWTSSLMLPIQAIQIVYISMDYRHRVGENTISCPNTYASTSACYMHVSCCFQNHTDFSSYVACFRNAMK